MIYREDNLFLKERYNSQENILAMKPWTLSNMTLKYIKQKLLDM